MGTQSRLVAKSRRLGACKETGRIKFFSSRTPNVFGSMQMLNRDMNLLVIRRFSSSTLQRTKQGLNKEQEGTDQLSFSDMYVSHNLPICQSDTLSQGNDIIFLGLPDSSWKRRIDPHDLFYDIIEIGKLVNLVVKWEVITALEDLCAKARLNIGVTGEIV